MNVIIKIDNKIRDKKYRYARDNKNIETEQVFTRTSR